MARFYVSFFLVLSSVILHGAMSKPLPAQSLPDFWTGQGFAFLQWLRVEDESVLYRSEVFMTTDSNQLNVYNTFKKEPFGSLARCGGLGCDLEQGNLVATLTFASGQNGTLLVSAATGSARFMQGARCQIEQSYLPVLTCYTEQGPNSINVPSMIRFSPGT